MNSNVKLDDAAIVEDYNAFLLQIENVKKDALSTLAENLYVSLAPVRNEVKHKAVPIKIIHYGYTPEWNDGEECLHGSKTLIENCNLYIIESCADISVKDFLGDDYDSEVDYEYENLLEEQVNTYDITLLEQLSDFIDDLSYVFQGISDRGTNYLYIMTIYADEITITSHDYHTGY